MIELLLLALAAGPRLATAVTGVDTWALALAAVVLVAVLLVARSRRRAPAHDL